MMEVFYYLQFQGHAKADCYHCVFTPELIIGICLVCWDLSKCKDWNMWDMKNECLYGGDANRPFPTHTPSLGNLASFNPWKG